MMLADRLSNIHTGPQGPDVAAFFDFDGTMLHGFDRVHAFFSVLWRNTKTAKALQSWLVGLSGGKTPAHAGRLRRLISSVWRGRSEEEFTRIEDRVFTHHIAGHLYAEAWQLIRAHRAAGHTVVIATAATRFQVRAAARELDIDQILCTEITVSEGALTGHIDGELLWGKHKADAVKAYAINNGIELTRSYGYSNGQSDVPMLSLVGNPTAVNPDRGLSRVAAERNWARLSFRARGRTGPYHVARTMIGLLAFIGAATAAFICSLGRTRRTDIDRMYRWVSTAALRSAGLRVHVTGAEYTRAPRPAVFVFNHQSQIDALVIPYVLRAAFIAVVTMKARRYPLFGHVMRFVGVTFIDSTSPAQAIRTMAPLVAELKSDQSVAIAPEGRVSPTPDLLPFKKGAFRLAAEASVPIIPIVIHNSGEALWRSATFIRPGTINVTVLEPIDISSWDPNTLDQNIERVRELYRDTLDGTGGFARRPSAQS